MKAIHNIEPIFNENSKILILGSMPSITSRNKEFFYMHPQNRFWKIFEELFKVKLDTIIMKKDFLLSHNIAVWDVIKSCNINGSSDSSIKNIEVNNLDIIINKANIKCIFCTGSKSYTLYKKYFKYNIPVICLPSSSSANAQYSMKLLINEYKQIIFYLK